MNIAVSQGNWLHISFESVPLLRTRFEIYRSDTEAAKKLHNEAYSFLMKFFSGFYCLPNQTVTMNVDMWSSKLQSTHFFRTAKFYRGLIWFIGFYCMKSLFDMCFLWAPWTVTFIFWDIHLFAYWSEAKVALHCKSRFFRFFLCAFWFLLSSNFFSFISVTISVFAFFSWVNPSLQIFFCCRSFFFSRIPNLQIMQSGES